MKMVDSNRYFKKKADVLRFFIKNAYKYQEAALDIQEFILFDRVLEYPVSCIPAVVNQVLSKLGVLTKDNDIYYEMLRLLEEYSFLDGDCCEVGA